jgi:transposase
MSSNHKKPSVESKNIDNDGLVAAMYDELSIGKVIDEVIEQDRPTNALLRLGQAVKAMVLNGLGFVNQRLYLFPKFFQDKPVERLIGEGICASDLNEHVMGRSLDDLYDYEVTGLYSQISVRSTQVLKLQCKTGHLDRTSFHTDGTYNYDNNKDSKVINETKGAAEGPEENAPKTEDSPSVIQITKGYSRDHRPDLNQVILQLIVENQAGIPLLMKPLDGNSDDKTSFRDTIKAHLAQLKAAHPLKYIISDSALYTKKSLQTLAQNPSIHWITRVPETLNEAKEALEEANISEMTVIDEQTRYEVTTSSSS